MAIKILKWLGLIFVVLLLVIIVGLYFFNRRLPVFIEDELNNNVKGYRFKVGEAELLPTAALEIKGLTVFQTGHPNSPVAEIPRWRLSLQWRHIFYGVLVSDYFIDHPTLHITLPQVTKEVQDEVPIHKKGWREAVYSFYPFKINELKIVNGDVTYIDQDSSRPLHLTHLSFSVGNIRNIQYPNEAYPSDIQLDGNIFDSGRVNMKGHANFLADPHAGIDANLSLQHVPLEPLLPVTERYNVKLSGGVLTAEGHLEYTVESETKAKLKTLTIENVCIDYVHTPETTSRETQRGKATVETAKKLQNEPKTLIWIDHVQITNSEFGFVNRAAKPTYRVFLSKSTLHLDNISNQFSEDIGTVKLTGEFMGVGNTVISGKFRPGGKSPDFDLNTKIEGTQMRSMNDLLRAYGSFDVTAGLFSLYSELTVKNGEVEGYIKPFFKDMKVYDKRQDKEKSAFHKLYEFLVGRVADLLKNVPREEVATKTKISGNLENPRFNTWETIVNLIKNAFFKAILPGFEKEVARKKT